MQPFIRSPELTEWPALRRIFHETRVTTFTWLPADRFKLEDFDAQTEGERMLVAVVDGQVRGFVSWWPPENFVHHLYVMPPFAGQGIGVALLTAALAEMGQPVRLKVMQPNERAKAFYLREGWTVEAEGTSQDGPYFLMQYA